MKIKYYLKALLYFIIPFISLLLIFTIFYYFDLLPNNYFRYIKIITLIISCLLSGFRIGKFSNQKGYLKGLILGSIIVLLFLFINLLTSPFKIYQIIYYLIIIIVTTVGSILGINKNKSN